VTWLLRPGFGLEPLEQVVWFAQPLLSVSLLIVVDAAPPSQGRTSSCVLRLARDNSREGRRAQSPNAGGEFRGKPRAVLARVLDQLLAGLVEAYLRSVRVIGSVVGRGHPHMHFTNAARFSGGMQKRSDGSIVGYGRGPVGRRGLFAGSRRRVSLARGLRGTSAPRLAEVKKVKYGIAWLVGVPPVLIAGRFLLRRC
jgi:hypothetical protein